MLKSGDNNRPPAINDDNNKLLSEQFASTMSVEPDSFRILYYAGASGSVPFTWESQPGTPKHKFSDTSLPPLTPPPSFNHFRQNPCHFNRSKSTFLHTIFSTKKSSRNVSPSSTPMNWPLGGGVKKSHCNERSRSVVRFGVEEEDEKGCANVEGSGTPTFCVGVRGGLQKEFQGRRRMNKLKNALMSIF